MLERTWEPSDLAIVIPCKDDPAVAACVASVPEAFPVVIAFNGSGVEFVRSTLANIHRPHLVVAELPQANLSRALETGIWAAPCDRVLLMDSDCVFSAGAVEAAARALAAGDPFRSVFKGVVRFADDGRPQTRLVARARQHHTAEVLTAYKPPLALDRRIASRIGGCIFDTRLRWREDADLDHRIRQAGIAILSVPECLIHHKPLTMATDLRSTFRYGVGEALADALGKKLTNVPRSVASTLRSQGISAALYMLFRNRVYTAGYIWAWLRIASGRESAVPRGARKP